MRSSTAESVYSFDNRYSVKSAGTIHNVREHNKYPLYGAGLLFVPIKLKIVSVWETVGKTDFTEIIIPLCYNRLCHRV